MTAADLIILLLIGLSALVGAFRGFIKEVLSLANWAAALLLAFMFREPLGDLLPFSEETSEVVRQLAAAGLIFFGVLIIGVLLINALSQLARVSGLSGTDRTLGLTFGLGRGLVIVMAILIFLPALVPVESEGWWTGSSLIPYFLQFEDWAMEVLGAAGGWIASIFNRD